MISAVQYKPKEGQAIIVGQGNFSLKTTDDLVRALISSAPGTKAGVAMNDGGMGITRKSGNDEKLTAEAAKVCHEVGAGHVFICIVEAAFPINFLNDLSRVYGVTNIFAATGNPVDILVYKTDLGNAVVGVVDGKAASSTETKQDIEERRKMLKDFGYHLG